jgi:Flp pilus assembly protein TadB
MSSADKPIDPAADPELKQFHAVTDAERAEAARMSAAEQLAALEAAEKKQQQQQQQRQQQAVEHKNKPSMEQEEGNRNPCLAFLSSLCWWLLVVLVIVPLGVSGVLLMLALRNLHWVTTIEVRLQTCSRMRTITLPTTL